MPLLVGLLVELVGHVVGASKRAGKRNNLGLATKLVERLVVGIMK